MRTRARLDRLRRAARACWLACAAGGCAAIASGERGQADASGDAPAARDASVAEAPFVPNVDVSCAGGAPPGPPRVARIAAGITGTCAVMTDRTVRCWGYVPSVTDPGAQVELRRATPVDGLHDVLRIALGETHACVVACGGRARCWGENNGGQLGDGTLTARGSPVELALPAAALDVVASRWQTCARLADGTLQCWGFAYSAELAGATTRDLGPVAVAGLDRVTMMRITSIGATNGAVRDDGSLWRWGVAASWDFARTAPRPARFDTGPGTSPVVSFVGDFVEGTCVLGADHAARCWRGDSDDVFVLPDPLLSMRVEELASSDEHLCGRVADGSVWCADRPGQGWRSFGQGAPPPGPQRARGPVIGIHDAVQITVGTLHACALLASGEVRCWGVGGYVGDGTLDTAYTPVTVRGLD